MPNEFNIRLNEPDSGGLMQYLYMDMGSATMWSAIFLSMHIDLIM